MFRTEAFLSIVLRHHSGRKFVAGLSGPRCTQAAFSIPLKTLAFELPPDNGKARLVLQRFRLSWRELEGRIFYGMEKSRPEGSEDHTNRKLIRGPNGPGRTRRKREGSLTF